MSALTEWDVEIFSDVYNAGTNEKATEDFNFYLIATAPNGRRFKHGHRFNSSTCGSWLRAVDEVNALLARVRKAQEAGTWTGPVSSPYWVEIDPAYGSQANVGAAGR